MAQSTLQELQKSLDGPQKESGSKRVHAVSDGVKKLSITETVMGMLVRGKSLSDGLVTLLYELADEPLSKSYAQGGRDNAVWRQWVLSLRDIIDSVQPELLLDSTANRKKVQRKGRDALHRLSRMAGVKKATLQEIGARMVEIIRETDRDAIDSKRWELPEVAVDQPGFESNPGPNAGLAAEHDETALEGADSMANMVIYDIRVPKISAANEDLASDSVVDKAEILAEGQSQTGLGNARGIADDLDGEVSFRGLEHLLAQTLRPGAWFKLYSAGSLGLRWLKLAHYDPETRLVQFENRQGDIIHEQDAVSLVADLVMGKIELVHDENAFEENLDVVIAGSRKTSCEDEKSPVGQPH